jgi:hypothetical protein
MNQLVVISAAPVVNVAAHVQFKRMVPQGLLVIDRALRVCQSKSY